MRASITTNYGFAIHGEDFGIYYSETKRAIIYLINHESLDEILKTINHEILHYIFDLFDQPDQTTLIF